MLDNDDEFDDDLFKEDQVEVGAEQFFDGLKPDPKYKSDRVPITRINGQVRKR